jgi:hypothetical protein
MVNMVIESKLVNMVITVKIANAGHLGCAGLAAKALSRDRKT